VFQGSQTERTKWEGLIGLIRETNLDLIQMRNLNIDPRPLSQDMGRGEGMGIAKMVDVLKQEFPSLQFGYFNRTRENFTLAPRAHQIDSIRNQSEFHDE